MTHDEVRIIELPDMADARGSLSFLQVGHALPFALNRVYYIYNVPGGATRGGHAHGRCEKLLIAVAGSLDVVVDDGSTERRWRLDNPLKALYVPAGLWHELRHFIPGTVCLVLASTLYDPDDYERDYRSYQVRARERQGLTTSA
jgi:dTDP-4-dehydrorhamnose 3,5-epimerase-like enzyme